MVYYLKYLYILFFGIAVLFLSPIMMLLPYLTYDTRYEYIITYNNINILC